ncbi:hypothetical protein KQY30_18315 [Streptomyces sp. GMY02]|uniref:hypothetical protein n=1 Tax=Streptomyces sp. GMY02 TaxID=1333528 RepID=UPI001C2C7212|nr:hypothetical protein [Streptomyces sp. GMY02]QXE35927.1 hypothetical protein KQY30_18315 [Streptomyces sp. GMY02]
MNLTLKSRAALGAASLFGLLPLTLTLTLPLTTATATAAAAGRSSTPEGTWRATVSREGAVYDVQMSFAPDRTVCLVSPAGASAGTWHVQGPHGFGYLIREMWYDANGAVEGWVDIDQDGARSGSSFRTTGVSSVFLPDGTLDSTVPVTITAVRTGAPDSSACA